MNIHLSHKLFTFLFFFMTLFYIFFNGDYMSDFLKIFTDCEGQGLVSQTNFCLLFTFLKGSIPVCFNFPSLLSFFFLFYLSILSCHVTLFYFFSFYFFSVSGSAISCEFIYVLEMISSSSVLEGPFQSLVSLVFPSSALSMSCKFSSCPMQLSERPMKTPLERMQAKVLSRVHRYLLIRQAQSMTRLRLLPCAENIMQQRECSSASSINFSSFFNFFKFSSHSLCVRSLMSLNLRYLMPWLSKQLGISAEQLMMQANLLIVRKSKSLIRRGGTCVVARVPRQSPSFIFVHSNSVYILCSHVILTNNAANHQFKSHFQYWQSRLILIPSYKYHF